MAFVATKVVGTFAGVTFQITDIDYGGVTAETVDVTHQLSSSEFKEYMAGLRDGGEITFNGIFDPASANTLIVGNQGQLTISRAGWAKQLTCTAILTNIGSLTANLGQRVNTKATFKITGVPTYA